MKRTHRRLLQGDTGFTLTELAVVVLIIGILLMVAVAAYASSTQAAADAACLSNQRTLESVAAEMRSSEDEVPPSTLEDLRSRISNFDSVIVCPLDEAPLVYDPDTGDVSCPNHQ